MAVGDKDVSALAGHGDALKLAEIASVFVRLDHVADIIEHPKSGALSVNAINILLEIARGQERRWRNRDSGRRHAHVPSAWKETGETLQTHE
jgi:hypothetical protein